MHWVVFTLFAGVLDDVSHWGEGEDGDEGEGYFDTLNLHYRFRFFKPYFLAHPPTFRTVGGLPPVFFCEGADAERTARRRLSLSRSLARLLARINLGDDLEALRVVHLGVRFREEPAIGREGDQPEVAVSGWLAVLPSELNCEFGLLEHYCEQGG